jgi:hypothetical protein
MKLKELDKLITTTILKPIYRVEDIEGAPYKIGDIVKVLSNPNNDDTFSMKFVGKEGKVEYFEYDCGCGQNYPEDPMIGIKFQNGKIAEFWKEELELIF